MVKMKPAQTFLSIHQIAEKLNVRNLLTYSECIQSMRLKFSYYSWYDNEALPQFLVSCVFPFCSIRRLEIIRSCVKASMLHWLQSNLESNVLCCSINRSKWSVPIKHFYFLDKFFFFNIIRNYRFLHRLR